MVQILGREVQMIKKKSPETPPGIIFVSIPKKASLPLRDIVKTLVRDVQLVIMLFYLKQR